MRNEVIEEIVAKTHSGAGLCRKMGYRRAEADVQQYFNLDLPIAEWVAEEGIAEDDIRERITAAVDKAAAERAERFGPEIMQ